MNNKDQNTLEQLTEQVLRKQSDIYTRDADKEEDDPYWDDDLYTPGQDNPNKGSGVSQEEAAKNLLSAFIHNSWTTAEEGEANAAIKSATLVQDKWFNGVKTYIFKVDSSSGVWEYKIEIQEHTPGN